MVIKTRHQLEQTGEHQAGRPSLYLPLCVMLFMLFSRSTLQYLLFSLPERSFTCESDALQERVDESLRGFVLDNFLSH